ncbi:MAG: hypothetical protein ACR2LJ_09595 [Acidimicrobiales bacterium]
MAPDERRPRGRRPALLLLALAAVLFLGFAARTIPAPFGDSHDGRNAGVWASGGRSLLERGSIESRLGTRSPENGVYANHPPLLYVETALFEAVGGRSATTIRAPAWLGSLATLALLTALLLQRGLRPAAVGAAVVLVAATPMLLVYGSMLDTPVTSLPFGLAVLLVWERARIGKRVPWPLASGLTAVAVLAGWQSLLLAALVGGWALVRLLRRSDRRTVDAAFVGGAVVGGLLLVGWLLWAFGGTLGPLLSQFRRRSGQDSPIRLDVLVGFVRQDTASMFGLAALLGVVGLVVAFADRRTRGLAAVAISVTLPYALVFRNAMMNHDYWNFWFLVPMAVGLAAAFDRLLRVRGATPWRDVAVGTVAALFAFLLTVGLATRPDGSEWATLEGRRAGTAALSQRLDPGQLSAWYTGAVGKPAAWLGLATGRPAVVVPVADLAALAAAYPHDLVLVGRMRCVNGGPRIAYGFEKAVVVVARPPEIDRC